MDVMSLRTLNDGQKIPILAFGTATAHNKTECSDAIYLALKAGFRHFDTADSYGNEASIGVALKRWIEEGGKRSDITITSKWGWSHDPTYDHDPVKSLDESLKMMAVDYIDLYLIHGPMPNPYTIEQAWKLMEGFQKEGKVRSIGISNFRSDHIERLAKMWTVIPVINEIEYHPYCIFDPKVVRMVETCDKYEIAIGGYTTLATLKRFPGLAVDGIVARIKSDRGEGYTEAQVLLAWARQKTRGGPIITTASKESQYKEILDSLHLTLSEVEMRAIDEAGMSI